VDAGEISKLDAYLKRLFGNPHVHVVPRQKRDDHADVLIGEDIVGHLTVDDEDDERSYNFEKPILLPGPAVKNRRIDAAEAAKLDGFLKQTLSPKLSVHRRPTKSDSADVHIGEEFIGVLFVDDNGYSFQMAILETDLEP
jgi:uncharacterized protein DUF3126